MDFRTAARALLIAGINDTGIPPQELRFVKRSGNVVLADIPSRVLVVAGSKTYFFLQRNFVEQRMRGIHSRPRFETPTANIAVRPQGDNWDAKAVFQDAYSHLVVPVDVPQVREPLSRQLCLQLARRHWNP